jgi:hypothetical protein
VSDLLCPSCKRGAMMRSARHTFMDRYIYPLMGLYPWRCKFCRHRERLRDRGSDSYGSSRRRSKTDRPLATTEQD